MKLTSATMENHRPVERSGVGAIQGDDLGVDTELGVQLAPPDIDGIDTGRTAGDQDLGGRRSKPPTSIATRPLGSKPKASSQASSL